MFLSNAFIDKSNRYGWTLSCFCCIVQRKSFVRNDDCPSYLARPVFPCKFAVIFVVGFSHFCFHTCLIELNTYFNTLTFHCIYLYFRTQRKSRNSRLLSTFGTLKMVKYFTKEKTNFIKDAYYTISQEKSSWGCTDNYRTCPLKNYLSRIPFPIDDKYTWIIPSTKRSVFSMLLSNVLRNKRYFIFCQNPDCDNLGWQNGQ